MDLVLVIKELRIKKFFKIYLCENCDIERFVVYFFNRKIINANCLIFHDNAVYLKAR